MVETLQHRRAPAPGTLQEGPGQPGAPFAYAAGHEPAHGDHHVEGVSQPLPEGQALIRVATGVVLQTQTSHHIPWHIGEREGMNSDRTSQLSCRVPERV